MAKSQGNTFTDEFGHRIPTEQIDPRNDPLSPIDPEQWKEGEWFVMIHIALDFDVYSIRTVEVFISGVPSPYIASWWIDPRPVHDGQYQYLAALFDIPVEILL